MPRLKDRQRQVPNGFRFEIPELNYNSSPFASFDTIVNSVHTIMQANAGMAAAKGWPTDRPDVADWIDEANASWCQRNGWHDFITATPQGGAPPNFTLPPQDQSRLNAAAAQIKKIWAGVKTLDQWIDSGEPAVNDLLASHRASICVQCPRNGQGDFTSWFTKPAAAFIQTQVQRLQKRNLATPYDAELGVCAVCLCPMKLKVHTPLKHIAAHMMPEVLADLKEVKGCWIVDEVNAA